MVVPGEPGTQKGRDRRPKPGAGKHSAELHSVGHSNQAAQPAPLNEWEPHGCVPSQGDKGTDAEMHTPPTASFRSRNCAAVSPRRGAGPQGQQCREGQCWLLLSLAWQMLGPKSQGSLQPALPSTPIPAFALGPSYIPRLHLACLPSPANLSKFLWDLPKCGMGASPLCSCSILDLPLPHSIIIQ